MLFLDGLLATTLGLGDIVLHPPIDAVLGLKLEEAEHIIRERQEWLAQSKAQEDILLTQNKSLEERMAKLQRQKDELEETLKDSNYTRAHSAVATRDSAHYLSLTSEQEDSDSVVETKPDYSEREDLAEQVEFLMADRDFLVNEVLAIKHALL